MGASVADLAAMYPRRFVELPDMAGVFVFPEAPVPLPTAEKRVLVQTLAGIVVGVGLEWSDWTLPMRLLVPKYGRPLIRHVVTGEPVFSVRVMQRDFEALWALKDCSISLAFNPPSWTTGYTHTRLKSHILQQSY